MGRLIGLELHNFKSYRGTCSVGFGLSNFISIIGPNGAGKSNMMDAISFVLGIRSSHLRSSQLRDLIYRGRLDEESDNPDDEDDPKNPKSAYVMAIYERGPDDFLKLKRTITTAGSSEYRINEKVVSFADFTAVLQKENILIKARNFLVFQGDVESIASKTPKERAELFETVSGSIEYKEEYERLRNELDKAHEETTALFQRKRLLTSDLKQYKEQKLESDEFDRKLEEKTQLVLTHRLWQLYIHEQNAIDLLEKAEELTQLVNEKEAAIKKAEKGLHKLETDFTKEQVRLLKSKADADETRLNVKESTKDLVPLTARCDHSVKRIAEMERKARELKYDISVQRKNVEELEKQSSAVKKSLKVFEEQHAAKKSAVDLPQESFEEYNELRQKFLSAGGALQEDSLLSLGSNRSFQITQIENLQAKHASLQARISDFEEKLSSLRSQYEDRSEKYLTASEDLEIKKKLLEDTRKKREQLAVKEFEINTELKAVLVRLDDLSALQRESSRERRLKENVHMLQRLFPGVKGLVHDLCRAKQKKYATAVDVVLGKNFDAVVVENTSVAQKCIAYLREQKAGVASFIPLDSVDPGAPNVGIRNIHLAARPVLDVLEYDPVLERAMQYVCGDAIVCDDIQVARELKWTKNVDAKLVSLDGSVIHRAGLMTGGLARTRQGGEVGDLVKQKDELMNKLNAISKEKPSEITEKQILNEIRELETELPVLESGLNEARRNVEDAETELRHQRAELALLEEEIGLKNETLKTVEAQIQEENVKIRSLRGEIYSDFEEKYEVDIEEYEKEHGILMSQQEEEKARFVKQIAALESRVDFEKGRLEHSNTRLERIVEDKERLEKELETTKAERSALQERIEVMEAELEVSSERITALEELLASKSENIENTKTEIKKLRREYQTAFKRCLAVEEDCDAATAAKMSVLASCKMQAVEIPLLEGSLEDLSAGMSTEELVRLADEIEIDYRDLPRKYRSSKLDEVAIEAQFTEKIKRVSEELEELSPNAKAVERLREVEARLREVEESHAQTRERELTIVDQFNEIKEKRYQKFMEAFNVISENIDVIYKDLTRYSSSPMGGSAYLNLEDEDEPYNSGVVFNVQVPLKRFVKMELLSGGEKTVAALALLFAIHSYQPSPFFVLDEIDAALDNNNVQRVANYIVKNSGPLFQFIVISLKNMLFEKLDALVGIYREQVRNSSKTVTLDMREYAR